MGADPRSHGATAPELRYEILGTIASGGMAEIQLARARGIEGFETLVAIKRILPHLAGNREFVEMFLDEARIAATLRHPNIVQVQGIGADEGDYFLVMEFLHGEDVRHLARAAREQGLAVPLEHSLSIALGVARALHYAHERVGPGGSAQQLIHRDVSPQNVIVTYDGGVKLVDFGIAKAASRLTETREGTLKGKVPYMSPEQCLEKPLDRRSDVFSLSVMLWELLVGRSLFVGLSEFEILKQIVEHDAPPVRDHWLTCPPDLDRIVAHGLRRDRDERYPSAQALQADLEAFVREHRVPVSSIGLAELMRRVFRDKLELFHAAQAGGVRGLQDYVRGRRALNTALATSSLAATVPDRGPPVPRKDPSSPLSESGLVPNTIPVVVAPRARTRRRSYLAVAAGLLCAGALLFASGLFREPRRSRAPSAAPAPAAGRAEQPAPMDPPPLIVEPARAPLPPSRHRDRPRTRALAATKPDAASTAATPPTRTPTTSSNVLLDP